MVHALERVDLGSWLSTQPPDGRERVLAAVLVPTRGDTGRLEESIRIAERDWRDALVWAGLGQPDWPDGWTRYWVQPAEPRSAEAE